MPVELPEALHDLLVKSYDKWKTSGKEDAREAFLARLYAVTQAGWPQSACARALGLSREAMRQLYNKANDQEGNKAEPTYKRKIPAPPPREVERVAPGREKVPEALIDSYVKRLLELQPLASEARGHHGPKSKERIASNKYSKLLKKAEDDGVPITVLAERIGRDPSGLRTRIRTADRIGTLGTSGDRHKQGVRDPKKVERWAKKLRPLLDELEAGGPNVNQKTSHKANRLVQQAVSPPNNITLRALAKATDRSYHAIWVRYASPLEPSA